MDLKEELLDLLEEIFDLYEDGPPIYSGPDEGDEFIGVAIRLDDETVDRIAGILEHHRPNKESA